MGIIRSSFPILEYDDNPAAKLNPTHFSDPPFDTDKLVITFFPEVIQILLEQEALLEDRVIPGENPIPICRISGCTSDIRAGGLSCLCR